MENKKVQRPHWVQLLLFCLLWTEQCVAMPFRSLHLSPNNKQNLKWVHNHGHSYLLTRGGGVKSSKPSAPPSSPLNLNAILDVAKSTAQSIWRQEIVQDALHTSPAEAAKKISGFVGKQRKKANQRRQAYRDDHSLNKTSLAILSGPRALKLTLAAFVVAEVLQFLETNSLPFTSSLMDKAEEITHDLSLQWDNFLYVGLAEGGLLNGKTWTNRTLFATAIQEQIEPKYQWALGAATGFVLSPLCWTMGWTALGWGAAIYMLAEAHHYCKAKLDKYYYTLQEKNNPIIFAVDDALEDVRKVFFQMFTKPKETILAMRDDIDERMDFEFPPHIQKGILFGAVVGVITGV